MKLPPHFNQWQVGFLRKLNLYWLKTLAIWHYGDILVAIDTRVTNFLLWQILRKNKRFLVVIVCNIYFVSKSSWISCSLVKRKPNYCRRIVVVCPIVSKMLHFALFVNTCSFTTHSYSACCEHFQMKLLWLINTWSKAAHVYHVRLNRIMCPASFIVHISYDTSLVSIVLIANRVVITR